MRACPMRRDLVRWIAPPQKKIGYTKARLQRELLHAARSWRKIGIGARLSSMGCGASKDASVTLTDAPVKGTAPSKGEPLPTPKKPLPSHPGMLKQPSGAAGTSSTAPAAATAHPASLRMAHPASLSSQPHEPAQDRGSTSSGSSAGNPAGKSSRKSSRRGASFSQSIVNKLGKGSIVGQVIGRAAELVEDSKYNIDEAAIISIQKMWRGKEASERVERMRVEVEVTNEASVRPHSPHSARTLTLTLTTDPHN